ncbi:NAD-dependent succinate-semialdehyde dehydrogenase [Actinomycetospora sp. NBRC 106378]|uniref:NAD-dependent succinate-semialdehyde dehydrogenase n=1 Tax=Actinomycetospora sp. NBRC 106378 TaxID=3032208 RepID=UPI0024A23A1C|nr:NAD-dependent succinate-semialdehyde dehydrogenase [Actinomycetospora sp. NBRC 106378]GLZ53519.1 succinate-semialdehyde dehydrogenase [Actinomycetospora sp. NBRC 106378]
MTADVAPTDAPTQGALVTVNPADGTEIARHRTHTAADIDQIVAAAHHAQTPWSTRPIAERAEHLRALARALRDARPALADLVVAEMGKPVTEARAEVDKCAWVCEYYAEHGPAVLADEPVASGVSRSWVAHEPLGVVLAVMPWNFPLWQVLRFAAPALLAGNAGLLKHSPNVTGTALAVEKIMRDAGLPPDIFRVLVVAEADVPDTVNRLLADDRVAAATLTGSERAGKAIAAAAGSALKKTVLELGGSDPFVVLDDADLDVVVPAAVTSRFLNSGQSCLAAKRFIVSRAIAPEFTRRFAAAVNELPVGDPTDENTRIGPLARADLVDALDAQVRASADAGASIVAGGHRLDRPGAWYAPTVLAEVTLDMPVMAEETFGPAAAVHVVDNDDEAAAVANATPYGLGASVWSRDPDRALTLGRRITSGALFVNAVVASDPRLPFGGTKRSGYGRELGSAGLLEFVNVRTYAVGA